MIIGYHGVRVFRREGMLDEPAAAGRAYERGAMISTGNIETAEGELSPFREAAGPADAGTADPSAGRSDQDEGESQQQ